MVLTQWSEATSPTQRAPRRGGWEYWIDWGPGYRVYFRQDGDTLIILLFGGTRRRQRDDIAEAQAHWAEYKRQK